MEFCCKFYGSIEFVQVVLFGLSLSLSMLNGVESDCNYFQNLEAGQTYYVYNPEYPNEYHGENHCIWKMASPYNTKIACSIEMSNINCSQGRLSILFADGKVFNYCGKNTVVLNGINPTIKFDSRYNSNGRFLCQIQTSNNNNNCNCGWKKVTRIVGGKTTEVNEYPMMCGLVDSVNKIIYCGCTIISEEYIITAAHCIEGRQFSLLGVVVGEHDTATGRETNATRLFRLVGCIIHPGYKSNRDAINDVAVCKIAGKIEYNAQVGPVCLPFQHKEDSCAGYIVTALGWGLEEFTGQKSDTLQEVDLNVITLGNCKKYYPDDGINYSNMCTYTPGKDTCQMDSGGPLLWQDPKTHKLVLVGITSSGVGCASDTPAVAMRTGAFIDWIVSITPGIHRRDEICRERGGGSEKRDRFGALHFYMSHAMESPREIRQIMRFLVDCESPWTTMGGRKRALQHGETSNYIGCTWKGRRDVDSCVRQRMSETRMAGGSA